MALTLTEKCQILSNAYADMEGDPVWTPLFAEYDLGFTFAFGVDYEMITLNQRGIESVEKAWDGMCEALGIDKYGDYFSFSDMVEFANE